MKVFIWLTVALSLLLTGCRSPQRCAVIEVPCLKQAPPAPVQPTSERPCAQIVQAILGTGESDEVRAARLRLAAAIVVVGGQIALEIIKASN